MKKIINLLTKMDKTKRIVILFITISFVSIIGISCYHSINKSDSEKQDIVIYDSYKEETTNNDDSSKQDVKEDTEKKETDQKKQVVKKEDKPQAQKKTENQKQNNQNKTTNDSQKVNKKSDSNNQKKKDNESQDKSDNQTQPPVEAETIQIKVEGIGKTMMSGKLEIDEESTALSVLKILASNNNMRILTSGFGSMSYVRGIGDLVEKEHGNGSGWMYKVNGKSPNVAAGSYSLKKDDYVVWYYVYSD